MYSAFAIFMRNCLCMRMVSSSSFISLQKFTEASRKRIRLLSLTSESSDMDTLSSELGKRSALGLRLCHLIASLIQLKSQALARNHEGPVAPDTTKPLKDLLNNNGMIRIPRLTNGVGLSHECRGTQRLVEHRKKTGIRGLSIVLVGSFAS
jgi:hypothetical protein